MRHLLALALALLPACVTPVDPDDQVHFEERVVFTSRVETTSGNLEVKNLGPGRLDLYVTDRSGKQRRLESLLSGGSIALWPSKFRQAELRQAKAGGASLTWSVPDAIADRIDVAIDPVEVVTEEPRPDDVTSSWVRVTAGQNDWRCTNPEGCEAKREVSGELRVFRFEEGDVLSTDAGWVLVR